MRSIDFQCTRAFALCAAVISFGKVASAASCPVLDDFTFPAAPRSAVLWGDSATDPTTAIAVIRDASTTILGGYRDAWIDIYNGNPAKGIAALAVGSAGPSRSVLSVAQGANVIAEIQVNYGAFTRPTPTTSGPAMGLDLGTCRGLKVDFTGVENSLNFVVVYYTSAPLTPDVYYMQNAVNIAPSSSGAPLSFVLDFGTLPFNWKRVDGIAVVINRSGPTPGNAYTLDRLAFVP